MHILFIFSFILYTVASSLVWAYALHLWQWKHRRPAVVALMMAWTMSFFAMLSLWADR